VRRERGNKIGALGGWMDERINEELVRAGMSEERSVFFIEYLF